MSQFGGSTDDDDFGYFGSQKPTPSASPFGAAPTTTSAPSPFGTPAATSGIGYGAPPPVPSGRGRSSRSPKQVVGLVGLGALIAVAGWFGWMQFQMSKPIVIPATLGGQPALVDPRITAVGDQMVADLRTKNHGMPLKAGLYGSPEHMTILLVTRGKIDVDGEWADAQVTSPARIGKSQCAVAPGADVIAVCIRSSRTLGIEAAVTGGTVAEASAALDEAWRAQ